MSLSCPPRIWFADRHHWSVWVDDAAAVGKSFRIIIIVTFGEAFGDRCYKTSPFFDTNSRDLGSSSTRIASIWIIWWCNTSYLVIKFSECGGLGIENEFIKEEFFNLFVDGDVNGKRGSGVKGNEEWAQPFYPVIDRECVCPVASIAEIVELSLTYFSDFGGCQENREIFGTQRELNGQKEQANICRNGI